MVFGIGAGLRDTGPQRAKQGEESLGSRAVSKLFRADCVAVCGRRFSRREEAFLRFEPD